MAEPRKSSRAAWGLVFLIFVVAGAATDASAGVILLSGDANITNELSSNAGNQQFFRNVLGSGSDVLILQGDSGIRDADVDDFYDGEGATSTIVSGTVTAASLSGIDLFVSILPSDLFSGSELLALEGFLSGGGTVFFMGENAIDLFAANNAAINAALTGLGSGMQIDPNSPSFDDGPHDAAPGQILADPLTFGVATFSYGAPSQISGGTTLFTGTGGEPFVAYESDEQPVPEPGTLLLLGAGLGALYKRRRA